MGEVIRIESSRSARALRERDRFLGKHPELKPLQREVDDMLRKAGSTHNHRNRGPGINDGIAIN
jgi:hypothetical protein